MSAVERGGTLVRPAGLPILTDAERWPLLVMGFGDSPRMREGKTTPDGEVTYGSGCTPLLTAPDGSLRAQKAASVHVVKPASLYEMGRRYVARGRIWVMPYTPSGASRGTLSITVEELVPAEDA